MGEKVVWVNEKDEVLGLVDKIYAHEKGILHRAISIIIFNKKGEMLIQQRAAKKYHSPLLWANACCSHPRENETYLDAANRRLKEELGFETTLEFLTHFTYKADVGQGMIEHELDHVFVGKYNETILPNPEEVCNYKWLSVEEITTILATNKPFFAPWFVHIFNHYQKQNNA